ncbi:DOCK-like protein [Wickerhamomyces ciferrii]|uniref:DOCK-like protein n=1 Tax=Wickerhamomyces ciferrii (strain ATCC 14091 / BCRC 22168 / CBS 111 / JCM 3599 / NBRC 0793 / NRRL Y-1031 F-60-10) TaxID=1206466 RepID=K0KNJ2_WICCF|nr:DOCK-like protein [Wickerhamomyces ciferrii]CCH43742.1 DOCK-like protein [Wickerhamomyces ciferrii]
MSEMNGNSDHKDEIQWSPLPMLAHGKVIKPFLPLDKFPSLKLSAFYKNLYPGDEVFLFETNNTSNWARGYLIVQPLPSDFIEKSSDLDKLPEQRVSVVIVPLTHIHIMDRLAMTSNFAAPSPNDFEYGQSSIPSIHDLQLSNTKARNGDLQDESANIKLKPPLPLVRLDSGDLLDELVPSLSLLASHIYSFYSVGEYALFKKLYESFDELNNLRIKLTYNLLTRAEKAQAKQQVSLLLSNISKFLSSKGASKFHQNSSAQLKHDSSGYQSVTARDVNSGELYDYWSTDLAKQPIPKIIAANQLAATLSPNFPVTNNLEEELKPKKITKFNKVTPSQILVDFKDVSGTSTLNPKGFSGMTAYLYLRTSKRRLTEAFAIHINSSSAFSLDKISAALFRNIPGTEVDTSRIYLVAIITEEIDTTKYGEVSESTIKMVRKGIAAGVADISRIFSRHTGALKTGESHQFTIKLFGSYVNKTDNTTLDPKNMNFGWGELIDRVISGSKKGVAVNPRAEKLVVSIKEFKGDLQTVASDFDSNIKTPIYQIRTNFFDPLVKAHDRIYLSMGKVNLTFNSTPFPGDLISIRLVNTNSNSKVVISKATNDIPTNSWDFTSVHSNEVVGESIKISGLENAGENESLKLHLYVNFEFKAEADLLVTNKGLVHEQNKSQLILFKNGPQTIASVEVDTRYVGKAFNVESAFQHILAWKRLYSLPEHEDRLIDTLKLLNQTSLDQSIKYFKELLVNLLQIFSASTKSNLTKLKTASFYAFIHLLDVVIARQEQYTYLYHEFVEEHSNTDSILPKVGADLIFMTASYFGKASTEWNYVGRTLCRISPLLLKISILALDPNDVKDFQIAWRALAQVLDEFLLLRIESMIPDQLLVLEYTDLLLEKLRGLFPESEVAQFGINMINAVGTRGLGAATDENIKLKAKETKIFITKLLLIRRLLNSWIFESAEFQSTTERFYICAINWAIEAYDDGTTDLDVLRLANSCLVSVCHIAWGVIVNKDEKNYIFPRSVSRLLLAIAELFHKVHQFARTNNLFEPKRTYTQLFPNCYPFAELIMDSVLNDVTVVEILVELGVIYAFITKISKNIASNSQGFVSILEASQNDTMFNSSKHFISSFSKEDLLLIIQTNRLLIQSKFFPSEKWISLHALLIESTTSSSELIKFILIRDHIPSATNPDTFDRSLWSKYLKSLLAMSSSMPASICHLAEVPRKAAWKITGDIRGRCASIINQSWDCLGWDSLKRDYVRFHVKKNSGYHVEFIQEDYGILEELMVFCLQRNAQCQIVGVKILWTIIIAELLVQETSDEPVHNKLAAVEKGCMIGLDKFFKSERYIPGLYEQRNFIKRLKMVIRLDPEDESFTDVYSFIQNLSEFLDIQNDLTSVPKGDEFDDERTFHDLDILRHLMRVNNAKKFHASLDDLYERNISKSNFTQAALCLELLASTYDWDVEEELPISIKPRLPAQTAFERKEFLYKMIASNLIKGSKLEKAVLIYKELAEVYDKINFNLKGLSFVHNRLSDLYLDLTTADRSTPTYFKVSFIGYGFPKTVRGRSFIYEGLTFEHINSIHNRLLRLHTGAKIISNDDEANYLIQNTPNGKFLHIVTVKPQVDFQSNHGNLSSAARLYMENKDLKYFTTSKRLQKSTSVLDLWVEETTYETFNTFPTLMNRSEIVAVENTKLSPIHNALRTLSAKTQDLVNAEISAQKSLRDRENKSTSFNELSRNLSGTVDAPVNGGIAQYREFFNVEVDPEDEELENDLSVLKSAFDNLAICISRCLVVHGKLVPESLKESHVVLIDLFEKNFKGEIKRTHIDVAELRRSIPKASASPYSAGSSTNSSVSTFKVNQTPQQPQTHAASQRIPSTISVNTSTGSTLTRVASGSSEKSSSRMSQVTTGSGGRKRSILNWRQSRQEAP